MEHSNKKDDRDVRSFWERKFEAKEKKSKFKEYDIYNNDPDHSESSSEDSDLKSEEDQTKVNEGEYTLFHYACSAGDPEIFTFVRDKCTDLQNFLFDKDCNRTQETPLHWAVNTNQIIITKMLIEDMKNLQHPRL